MVLLVLAHALVADHRLACLNALDEAQPLELVEDPVDARAAHPASLAAQRILDLNRGQRTRLAVEQLDHRAARAAALVSCGGERRLGAIRPLPGGRIGSVGDVSPHITMVEA